MSDLATQRRYLALQRHREKALLACAEVTNVHGLVPFPEDILHACVEELIVTPNQEWGAVTPIGTQNSIVHRIMTLASQRLAERQEQERLMQQLESEERHRLQEQQNYGTQYRALPADVHGQPDHYQAMVAVRNERQRIAEAIEREAGAQKQNELREAMQASVVEKQRRESELQNERAQDAQRCEVGRQSYEQEEREKLEKHEARILASRQEVEAFEQAEKQRKMHTKQRAQQEREEYLEIFRLQHEAQALEEKRAADLRRVAAIENRETLADQLRLRSQEKQRDQQEDQRLQRERDAVMEQQERRKQERLDAEAAAFMRRLGMGTQLFTSTEDKKREEEERLARHCLAEEERLRNKHEFDLNEKQRARQELLATLEWQIKEKQEAGNALRLTEQEEYDRSQNEVQKRKWQDEQLQKHNAQMTQQFHGELCSQMESDRDRRMKEGAMHTEEANMNRELLDAFQHSKVTLLQDKAIARSKACTDRESLLRNTGLRTIY